MDQVIITDKQLIIKTDEGKQKNLPVSCLRDMYRREFTSPNNIAMPDGIKFVESSGPLLLCVHEQKPMVRYLNWPTARDGPKSTFKVRLSFPYVVIFVSFNHVGDGYYNNLGLSNRLYFSKTPVLDKQTKLYVPALLNVFNASAQQWTNWICTQYFRPGPGHWTQILDRLLDYLWNTPFNNDQRAASCYAKYVSASEVSCIENWHNATFKDKDFALKYDWLPSDLTVGEVMESIMDKLQNSYGFDYLSGKRREKPSTLKRIVQYAKV